MSSHTAGIVFACLMMPFGWLGGGDGPVLAAEKPKKEVRQSIVQPGPQDKQTSVTHRKTKPSKATKKSDRDTIPKLQSQTSIDGVVQHAGRKKTGKKMRPQATVQPKRDLSYHGMLEHPQRYDPSPEHRKGGARNPQAGELLHDHFQELDKNHDGMLDPFERSLGRLDMDRDLSNRQWE